MQDTFISKADLLYHLEKGDEDAFQEIYEHYWLKLYRMAVSKVKCQENAKELVQDVFMDLWNRRGEVHIDDLDRYLFRAVKYGALKLIRKEIVRRQYQESYIETASELSHTTENILAFDELSNAINNGIERLPEKVREIFRLNRIQHLSAREISELLKIPERTVEYHLALALRLMRGYLKDFLIFYLVLYSL